METRELQHLQKTADLGIALCRGDGSTDQPQAFCAMTNRAAEHWWQLAVRNNVLIRSELCSVTSLLKAGTKRQTALNGKSPMAMLITRVLCRRPRFLSSHLT